MRALFVVLCLALAFGCSSSKPPERPHAPASCDRSFPVSPEFSEKQREALADSVARWNDIALEAFCVEDAATAEESRSSDHGVYLIQYGGPEWQHLRDLFDGADVIGVHWGRTDQIGIVSGLSAETFVLVAIHEFGHAHGLGHTEPPSIMCAYVGTATDFTDKDLAECRRVGACESDAGAAQAREPGQSWVVIQ